MLSDLLNSIQVRVITYNVLCSHLAPAHRFRNCKPENLEANTRLERVKSKLDKETSVRAICCLQEVGMQWCSELHSFFAARDYVMVHTLYGRDDANFMGVCIAFPRDKFAMIECDIVRTADTKPWPVPPVVAVPAPSVLGVLKNLVATPLATLSAFLLRAWKLPMSLWNSITSLSRPSFPPLTNMLGQQQDCWEMSRRRQNQQILLRLRPRQPDGTPDPRKPSFCVSTYHMPCVFWDQRVMTIHSTLAARYVQRKAGSDPYILAGDFNIKPFSGAYSLLTQGKLDAAHPDHPPPRQDDPWKMELEEGMESAYAKVQGREPDFTNYAQINREEPFIDCIDYIFHKPGMKAITCDMLPGRAVARGPFPTADEPSDHILLGAEYEI
mmetsp:Transcript_7225/g.17008  ORF Transcript_7225/g.17008 Transcript_7225/m.17008 type:complete len:383 (+) Transcript_7225:94-1242(+)